jgi:hypothetical protein
MCFGRPESNRSFSRDTRNRCKPGYDRQLALLRRARRAEECMRRLDGHQGKKSNHARVHIESPPVAMSDLFTLICSVKRVSRRLAFFPRP